MHGGHKTLLDAESFLEKDVDDGSEAVGGAAGVGNDAVLGNVELLVVHTHDDSDVLVLGRSGDDDLLGAGGDVALGLLTLGEESGRLDHDIDSEVLPGKGGGAFLHGEALDLVAVHDEGVVLFQGRGGFLAVDLTLEDALGGIVLHEVSEIVGGDEIVDGDDFIPLFEEPLFDDGTEDEAADAAEPIDGDIWHVGVVGMFAPGAARKETFLKFSSDPSILNGTAGCFRVGLATFLEGAKDLLKRLLVREAGGVDPQGAGLLVDGEA